MFDYRCREFKKRYKYLNKYEIWHKFDHKIRFRAICHENTVIY